MFMILRFGNRDSYHFWSEHHHLSKISVKCSSDFLNYLKNFLLNFTIDIDCIPRRIIGSALFPFVGLKFDVSFSVAKKLAVLIFIQTPICKLAWSGNDKESLKF